MTGPLPNPGDPTSSGHPDPQHIGDAPAPYDIGYDPDTGELLGEPLTHEERLAILENENAKLAEALLELAKKIEQPAEDDEPDRSPSRWSRHHQHDRQRRAADTELRGWVDWLTYAYALDKGNLRIKPCWYAHSLAVHHLEPLMAAWRAAYYGNNRARDSLIAWHIHWLWPTLNILSEHAGWGNCTNREGCAAVAGTAATDNWGDTQTGPATRTQPTFADYLATEPNPPDTADPSIHQWKKARKPKTAGDDTSAAAVPSGPLAAHPSARSQTPTT